MPKLKINIDISKELKEKISDRLNRNNLDLDSYLLELIIKDMDSRIYFEKNFSFDYESKKLYIENLNFSKKISVKKQYFL